MMKCELEKTSNVQTSGRVSLRKGIESSSLMKKYVAFYDCHFGYELRKSGDRRVRRALHCTPAINAALEFTRDFKPDVFILGGDQLDFGAISFHNHGKPRLVEGLRITDDYKAIEEGLLKPLDALKIPWKVWLTGNHENRIHRYLDANPEAEGLIEPDTALRLNARGWFLQPEEVPYKLGKIHFVHGHACFPRGGCKDPAMKLVSHYRRNVRCGHLHRYDVATDITPADRRDYHTGIVVPALCRANPGYNGNASDNFQQGFIWGYVMDNGDFTDYVSVINGGRFIALGKEYRG